MPNNIIKEINRASIALASTSEICFAAIEIPKQNLDVALYSITFGCVITALADKQNFISQYACVLRNASIDNNFTALPLSPTAFPSGSDVLWFGNASDVGSVNQIDFGDRPFILQGGNNYLIYVCQPAFNGARTASIYTHISVNAEVLTNRAQGEWRLY